MNEQLAVSKQKTCYKCGFQDVTSETSCPQCKHPLQTSLSIRIRGLLLILCGGILMPLMDYITVWILGAANSTDPLGPKFNGSRGELLMTFAICGLVILFGFIVFVAGLWQLILGRRNKIFVWSVAGLGAVLFAVAGYFYWAN